MKKPITKNEEITRFLLLTRSFIHSHIININWRRIQISVVAADDDDDCDDEKKTNIDSSRTDCDYRVMMISSLNDWPSSQMVVGRSDACLKASAVCRMHYTH